MKRDELSKYLSEAAKLDNLLNGPLRSYFEQQKQIDKALQSLTISTATDSMLKAMQQFQRQQDVISQTVLSLNRAFDTVFHAGRLARLGALGLATASFESINAAVLDAEFLAELPLCEPGEGEEEGEGESETELKSQLIEVVSEETFEQLERIEFAPLRILENAIRDPRIMRKISPRQFEEFIAYLIDLLGFEDVVLTPESGDGGRDIVATKNFEGIPVIFAFECKRYAEHRTVGVDIARALLGTIGHRDTPANKGVLVTTSQFSSGVHKLFLTEPRLSGRDFDGVVEWVKKVGDTQ